MKRVIFLSIFLLSSCGEGDLPTAPTDVTNANCVQGDVGIKAQRSRTGLEVNFFDAGEVIVLTVVPLNIYGGTLSSSCSYTRTASWSKAISSRSAFCDFYGEEAGLQKLLQCDTFAGDAQVTIGVKHGGFGNSRVFKVVQ